MEEKQGLVRVNTRIGVHHNDWLDKESARTGVSKSGLIQLAIDSYKMQNEVIYTLDQMTKKIDDLGKLIEEKS